MIVLRRHSPRRPGRGKLFRIAAVAFRVAVLLCLIPAPAARAAVAATSTTQAIPLNQPSAATAEAEELAPPLSIYESCQMINTASRLLSGKSDPPPPATARLVDRILSTIIIYVDRVDRAHSTLPFYAWEDVISSKASKEGWDTLDAKVLAPIPQVTALSIRAHHGDIEIKYLAAIDKDQTKWEFNQTIHVTADSPRPEICFLPLPTQLTEIRVTSRVTDPKAVHQARLFIGAGVSSVTESAKQANYYLQLARVSLKAGKIPEARRHLREGYEMLREYQKNRRF